MAITEIRINNLRLIQELELKPAHGLNLIWGANGSGKTSILEALYLLGRGKSFRKTDRDNLIRAGEKQLALFIRTENATGANTLGLIKSQGATQARLNGTKITRMSDLARAVPLTVITPNSHEILERGPQYRRRFLDWGVFHVEPEFRQTFERYARCLKQRNASLRTKGGLSTTWDRELIETGIRVNRFRERYFELFSTRLKDLAAVLLGLDDIQVSWNRGWTQKSELGQCLEDMRQGDTIAGYTRYGPHRADLTINIHNRKAEKYASRGQQKMLVAAMHLAQLEIAHGQVASEPTLLIDDLASELDGNNRQLLLNHLNEMGIQTFITGVEDLSGGDAGFHGVFHVEQGQVSTD
jgi:DNA replication and repair protein RecF